MKLSSHLNLTTQQPQGFTSAAVSSSCTRTIPLLPKRHLFQVNCELLFVPSAKPNNLEVTLRRTQSLVSMTLISFKFRVCWATNLVTRSHTLLFQRLSDGYSQGITQYPASKLGQRTTEGRVSLPDQPEKSKTRVRNVTTGLQYTDTGRRCRGWIIISSHIPPPPKCADIHQLLGICYENRLTVTDVDCTLR